MVISAAIAGGWSASERCSLASERRRLPMKRRPEAAAACRVAAGDWRRGGVSLGERGYATTAALLTTEECRGLAALYDGEEAFRSRVVMQRHGFGSGEY